MNGNAGGMDGGTEGEVKGRNLEETQEVKLCSGCKNKQYSNKKNSNLVIVVSDSEMASADKGACCHV